MLLQKYVNSIAHLQQVSINARDGFFSNFDKVGGDCQFKLRELKIALQSQNLYHQKRYWQQVHYKSVNSSVTKTTPVLL